MIESSKFKKVTGQCIDAWKLLTCHLFVAVCICVTQLIHVRMREVEDGAGDRLGAGIHC